MSWGALVRGADLSHAPGRGGDQFIPRPEAAAPGRPAPWAALPEARRVFDRDGLVAALGAADGPRPSPVERAGVRPSAVLAPLYEHDGELHIVLTRRAKHLRAHRGEVSFPGGAVEPGESPVEGALREAFEEVALDPSSVEVIGELDHLQTFTSRSFIVPFVGLLPGRPTLVPSPDEVDAVLHVPVRELLLDEVFREERWGLEPLARPLWFFELVGDTVWGATAAMLRNLLALGTGTAWRD
ncbi:MAG: CoA pyrophosphatase [Acidimicrobiales bacterium]|nr:CoA pyrophosphatase [Acidimicrobiales bacterium]